MAIEVERGYRPPAAQVFSAQHGEVATQSQVPLSADQYEQAAREFNEWIKSTKNDWLTAFVASNKEALEKWDGTELF